jgi:hypothetical protein
MTLTIAALAFLCAARPQDSKKEQLKTALKDDAVKGNWNYDDLGQGYAEATKSGRPMMVVFR